MLSWILRAACYWETSDWLLLPTVVNQSSRSAWNSMTHLEYDIGSSPNMETSQMWPDRDNGVPLQRRPQPANSVAQFWLFVRWDGGLIYFAAETNVKDQPVCRGYEVREQAPRTFIDVVEGPVSWMQNIFTMYLRLAFAERLAITRLARWTSKQCTEWGSSLGRVGDCICHDTKPLKYPCSPFRLLVDGNLFYLERFCRTPSNNWPKEQNQMTRE